MSTLLKALIFLLLFSASHTQTRTLGKWIIWTLFAKVSKYHSLLSLVLKISVVTSLTSNTFHSPQGSPQATRVFTHAVPSIWNSSLPLSSSYYLLILQFLLSLFQGTLSWAPNGENCPIYIYNMVHLFFMREFEYYINLCGSFWLASLFLSPDFMFHERQNQSLFLFKMSLGYSA